MNSTDPFRLDGRHVLITGGTKGLGAALAAAVADAGARVTITGRRETSAEEAATRLATGRRQIRGIQLEVTDAADVERAFSEAEEAYGPVTGLVNNAGVSIGAEALGTRDETWRSTMATNLDGVWHVSRAFARRISAEPSSVPRTIVNIGSISAQIVNQPRWHAPYLASKAAVHQLSKALAAEWASRGIRVNAIAPGYFLTELAPVDQPEYYDSCVAPAALKRWGEPHELGPAAVFLLGEASSFMTGSIVVIDGGFTLF